MSAVILIGKLLVILSWVMIIRMILNFRKEEESAEIRFDLLSSMDISVCIGISLVALFSSLEESAALFTLIVIAVALFMINTQRYRILLAGKEKSSSEREDHSAQRHQGSCPQCHLPGCQNQKR